MMFHSRCSNRLVWLSTSCRCGGCVAQSKGFKGLVSSAALHILCIIFWAQTRCGNENVVYKFEFWMNYAYRFSFDITIKLNVNGDEVVQTKESKSFTTWPPAS